VCSLHEQSRGTGFERREGSLCAVLHLARLALILGSELVGDRGGESFAFLSALARREFPQLLRLRLGIQAALDSVPQLRDVTVCSDVCSSIVMLHAGEVLPLHGRLIIEDG
jgi:hypothetical protein